MKYFLCWKTVNRMRNATILSLQDCPTPEAIRDDDKKKVSVSLIACCCQNFQRCSRGRDGLMWYYMIAEAGDSEQDQCWWWRKADCFLFHLVAWRSQVGKSGPEEGEEEEEDTSCRASCWRRRPINCLRHDHKADLVCQLSSVKHAFIIKASKPKTVDGFYSLAS